MKTLRDILSEDVSKYPKEILVETSKVLDFIRSKTIPNVGRHVEKLLRKEGFNIKIEDGKISGRDGSVIVVHYKISWIGEPRKKELGKLYSFWFSYSKKNDILTVDLRI